MLLRRQSCAGLFSSLKPPLLSHGKILSAAKDGSDHARYSNIKCQALGVHANDAKRLATLFGEECVELMPNIKFVRIGATQPVAPAENPIEKNLPPNTPFLVLGSIRREEEHSVENIIRDILRKQPQAVIGLFPWHQDRIQHWTEALNRLAIKWTLRSKIEKPVSAGTVRLSSGTHSASCR